MTLSDRLATLLAKERTDARTYIGCMKKGPVITDPKMKWQVKIEFYSVIVKLRLELKSQTDLFVMQLFFRYESQGHLIGNEYFLHAYAPLYMLSAEVVASLASSRNNR